MGEYFKLYRKHKKTDDLGCHIFKKKTDDTTFKSMCT